MWFFLNRVYLTEIPGFSERKSGKTEYLKNVQGKLLKFIKLNSFVNLRKFSF